MSSLKDNCWKGERIDREKISLYQKISELKNTGLDIGIHELVLEQLKYRSEKENL